MGGPSFRHAEASIGPLDDGVRATWGDGNPLADVTIGALSSVSACFLQDAIWAGSGGAANEEIASGRLTSLTLDTAQFTIPIVATTRRSAQVSTTMERLLDSLRDIARTREGSRSLRVGTAT